MYWSEIVRLFEKSFFVGGWRVHPCSKKGQGSSLIENEVDDKSYVITGSDSEYRPLSLKRIERVREAFSLYKGKKIDCLVFLGNSFSEEARDAVCNGTIANMVLIERGEDLMVYQCQSSKEDFLVTGLKEFLAHLHASDRSIESRLRAAMKLRHVPDFSRKKPKEIVSDEIVDSIRILAFSDWRVQKIDDVFTFIQNVEPVDFVFYAGDDIGRFEEEGLNAFTELAKYTKSNLVLAVIGNDDFAVQKRVLKAKSVLDLYDRSCIFKLCLRWIGGLN
jgi:hypothetical protein